MQNRKANNPVTLGRLLKHMRLKKGFVITEIESKCGVDRSQISRIERGEFVRVSENVQKICKLYGVAYSDEGEANTTTLIRRCEELAARSPEVCSALATLIDALEEEFSAKNTS